MERETREKIKDKRENRAMKFFIFLTAICSLLLVFACSNPVTNGSSSLPPPPEGMGYFSVRIGGINLERSILPEITVNDFNAYDFVFTRTTGTAATVTFPKTPGNLSEDILLEAGTWDLIVTAFLDIGKTKPAAQGSLTNIDIPPGGSSSNVVNLFAIINGSENGTFRWDIMFPASLTEAKIEIAPWPSGAVEATITLSVAGTQANGSQNLNPGYYNVIFTLTRSGDPDLVRREILHVYQNMESLFTFDFKEEHFRISNAETPVISSPPLSNSTYDIDEPAEPLTVIVAPVTDGGTLTYQWESSIDEIIWSSIPSQSGSLGTNGGAIAYTPPTDTAETLYYRVVITNTNTNVNGDQSVQFISNTAKVEVKSSTPGVGDSWAPPTNNAILQSSVLSIVYGTNNNGVSKFLMSSSTGQIAWSIDGLTWNVISSTNSTIGIQNGSDIEDNTTFPNNAAINAMAFGNVLFGGGLTPGIVAVSSTGHIGYSVNGINWRGVLAGDESGSRFPGTSINDIAYGTVNSVGRFIAVGDGNRIRFSDNGITWNPPTGSNNAPFGTSDIRFITFGNVNIDGNSVSRFIAIDDTGRIAYSESGTPANSWIIIPTIIQNVRTLNYINGRFFIGKTAETVNSSSIMWSDNGIDWVEANTQNLSSNFFRRSFGFAYGNGLLVAVGNESDNLTGNSSAAAWSVDNGLNWNNFIPIDNIRPTGVFKVNGIAYGAGKFIVISSSQSIRGRFDWPRP